MATRASTASLCRPRSRSEQRGRRLRGCWCPPRSPGPGWSHALRSTTITLTEPDNRAAPQTLAQTAAVEARDQWVFAIGTAYAATNSLTLYGGINSRALAHPAAESHAPDRRDRRDAPHCRIQAGALAWLVGKRCAGIPSPAQCALRQSVVAARPEHRESFVPRVASDAESSMVSSRNVLPPKLSRPSAAGLAVRERLFALLDRFRRRPITWVEGPPGAGKTSLASSLDRGARAAMPLVPS